MSVSVGFFFVVVGWTGGVHMALSTPLKGEILEPLIPPLCQGCAIQFNAAAETESDDEVDAQQKSE